MEKDSGGSSPQSQPGNQGKSVEPTEASSEGTLDAVREQILAEKARISASGIDRTNLDPEMMRRAIKKQTEEKEIKVAEQLKAKANEPLKPFLPIENYKMATPCSSAWEGSDIKERVRFCQRCQLQVYDLTGLQQPEADDLIYKRENRKNVTLFKRQDGKFLTSDCPLAARAKRDRIIAIVAGGAIVACIGAALALMPKPPAPAVVPEPVQAAKPAKSTGSGGPGQTAAKTPPPGAATPGAPAAAGAPGSSAYSEYLKSQQGLELQPRGETATQPAAQTQAQPAPQQDQPPTPAPTPVPVALPQPPSSTAAPAESPSLETPGDESQASQPAPASDQPPATDHGVKYYGR